MRSYVYLLVDPRTGRAFYVGRGRGDRCFRHVRAAGVGPGCGSGPTVERPSKYPMLERIHEIEDSGRSVRIDILRYGLSPDEARLVEAAAHDVLGFPGVTASGSQRRSVDEVGAQLAKRAKFKPDHRVVLLRAGGPGSDVSYDRIRHGWRIGRRWIDPASTRSPRWAVTVAGEVVAAVYRIEWWEPDHLHRGAPEPIGEGGAGTAQDRFSFVGQNDPDLEKRYVGKSVAGYVGAGSQSPVTYVWCGPHWVNQPV